MKSILKALVLPAILVLPLATLGGCSETVAHDSQTKRNWDGSVTHKDTTVREGIDGSRTVEENQYKVRN